MLIPTHGKLLILLVWSPNPIPSSIPMPPQSPCIIQSSLISTTASKHNNHSIGTTSRTMRGCMVYTSQWGFTLTLQSHPREWTLFHIQTPYFYIKSVITAIIYGFLASVTSKYDQEWFSECQTQSIPPTRSGSYYRHDSPYTYIYIYIYLCYFTITLTHV